MLPRKTILLVSLVLVLGLLDSVYSQGICPANQARVTALPNGTLMFPPLPAGRPNVDTAYDAGALEGWFNLANSFADAVRSGGLPYDLIQESIIESNLPCDIISPPADSCDNQDSDFDALQTVRDFATWWVPILVVSCLGAVLAVSFLLAGCIFWCCRCCGYCGGGRKQTESSYMDCKTFLFTSILLALTLVLLVGVVLAFFSNEKSFDSLENFQDALLSAASDSIDFTETGLLQGDSLVCQFNDVATISIDDARTVQADLVALAEGYVQQANAIFDTLTNISSGLSQQGLDNITDLLTNIDTLTSNLQSEGMMLNSDLADIRANVSAAETSCMGTLFADACAMALGSIDIAAAVDFSQLPDVTEELNNVQNSNLGAQTLLDDISNGRGNITAETQGVIDDVNMQIDDVIAEVESINQTVFDRWLNDIRDDVSRFILDNQDPDDCPGLGDLQFGDDVNVGYIRQCVINEAFDEVQQYDQYRYGFGIAVCSLALVTVVLVLVGIVMGVFGFRRDVRPYKRTGLSHCGGIFLLIGVGFTFLFAFCLLVLAAIMFFFGANAVKGCNALEGPGCNPFVETCDRDAIGEPNYELYTRVVDNITLWGGSLIGSNAFDNSSEIFSLSEALENCRFNEPLYSALNLSNLVNVADEFVDTREFIDQVRVDVTAARDTFLNTYEPGDFLDLTVQDSLTEFANASLDSINISAFREQIGSELLQFNINDTISVLETLQVTVASEPDLVSDIGDIITGLQNVQMNRIPAIETDLDQLEMDVNELSMLIDTLLINTSSVAEDINILADNLTAASLNRTLNEVAIEPLDTVIDYTTQFLDHFTIQIEREVARCQPLWGIYRGIYNSACRDILDGWNGAWWSLGFCVLFFVPVIIFSVITSNFYLRKKYFEYDDSYTDYPLKSY